MKHPDISLSHDGSAKPYIHGNSDKAAGTIALGGSCDAANVVKISGGENSFELLSEEEIQENEEGGLSNEDHG